MVCSINMSASRVSQLVPTEHGGILLFLIFDIVTMIMAHQRWAASGSGLSCLIPGTIKFHDEYAYSSFS